MTTAQYNLLPLEAWRRLFGYNPWHFWGLSGTVGASALTSNCNAIVPEYEWQDADAAGRASIREAIMSAEAKLTQYLGYAPAPHYVEETHEFPRYADNGVWRRGFMDSSGRWISVQLRERRVHAVGVEARTAISLAAAVTYSDADGDGLNDTFSISAATTVTDTDQIAVYFAAADRLNSEGVGERWRIAPVRVSISGGTVTITGPSWLCVKPIKYEGASAGGGLDITDSANFVTTLAIYRRYTDPTGTTAAAAQAMLTFETDPGDWWGGGYCCGSSAANDDSTDPAAIATAVARVGIRDARNGIVTPAEAAYNSTTGLWAAVSPGCRPPDRVTVRFYAGADLEGGQMQSELQRVVARLAAAELDRPICACDSTGSGNRALHRWQFDLARTSGANDEAYGAVSAEDLRNPLGTRAGQVHAWKYIVRHAGARGFSV